MTVLDFPVPFQEGDRNPFDVDVVNLYRNRKWTHLIPLPYGKQDPPPTGFSGKTGRKPDANQYKEWIKNSRRGAQVQLGLIEGPKISGPSNIAIVHGFDTISIDVDEYDYIDKKLNVKKHKYGGRSLKKLEAELGALPTTWISSARGAPDQTASGQRFFRLHPDHATNKLRYNDKPADAIEIVRGGHRYSVVWPSMNGRLGEQYVWWKKVKRDGVDFWRVQSTPPAKEELPFLPDKWVEFLTSDFTPYEEVKKTAAGVYSRSDMVNWIDERAKNGSWETDDNGKLVGGEFEPEMCKTMSNALDNAMDELTSGSGGAHDVMARKLWHVMQLAYEGHSGLKVFLQTFHESFTEEVQGRRDGGQREAIEEWDRALAGAFERSTAREDPIATSCPCFKGDAGGFGGTTIDKDPADFVQNDDGNAELLVKAAEGRMRHASGWDDWLIWDVDAGYWRMNAEQDVVVLARTVSVIYQQRASEMFEYAAGNGLEKLERERVEKKAKKLYAWGIMAGNRNRINSMIDLAKSHEGVSSHSTEFNSDPRIIACRNGTIELAPRRPANSDSLEMSDPIIFRDSSRDDFNTCTTGVDYMPWSEIREGGEGAALMRSKRIVEDYLETFIPLRSLRWYVQRVLGYGMYGANPERKIVFLHGPTSSGKSTILSAISAALGGYAGPFNLSLLRDKQDEGPRAELVNAFHRRIISATEGGGEWHLHADMIKRITGGSDTMSARKLFSNNIIEVVPNFTPFIASNSPPTIDAADTATYRRLLVLPFDRQVGIEGSDVSDESVMQKAGMDAFMAHDVGCRMVWLSWLVDGYAGYVREGIAEYPAIVQSRTEEFCMGLNDLNSFLGHSIVSGVDALGRHLPFRRLYAAYEAWCFENGIKERDRLSAIGLGRKLRSNSFEMEKRWARRGDLDYVEGRKVKGNYLMHTRFITPDDAVEATDGKFNIIAFDKQFDK